MEGVESKGKTKKEILKFLLVAMGAGLIQFALVNILYFSLKWWKDPLPNFLSAIFNEDAMGKGNSTWGYFLPFFLSNTIANVIAYFINKKKTFDSDSPTWHFVLYFIVMVLLIFVMTWLQGVIVGYLKGGNAEAIAPTVATVLTGILTALIQFPLQKYVFLRNRK